MKEYLKKALFALSAVVISALVGVLLLCAVYLLPTENIKKNSAGAVYVFAYEGSVYESAPSYPLVSLLDNYTDCIILMESFVRNEGEPFYKAALAGTMLKSTDPAVTPVGACYYYFFGESGYENENYERYWHGYQIFTIVLLQFFTYLHIRYINLAVQTVLLAAACLAVRKKKGPWAAFLGAAAALYLPALYQCLQYSSMVYITLVSVIAFCFAKEEDFWKVYLFAGIATAYFDLLTYPVLAPGVLAVLTVCELYRKDKKADVIKKCFFCLLAWAVGYVGMWAMKWLITAVVLDPGAIKDAAVNVDTRVNGGFGFADVIESLGLMFSSVQTDYMNVICILFVCAALAGVPRDRTDKKAAASLGLFLLAGLLPFCWFFFTKNHTGVHEYLAFRNLGATYFALFAWIELSFCKKKIKTDDKGLS